MRRRASHRSPIGQTISHYRILAKLGGGGMGVVYNKYIRRLNVPVDAADALNRILDEKEKTP